MPTISQLPIVDTVTGHDQLPLSQDGVAKSTSVNALLAGLQSTITLASGALLGRSSMGAGEPEPIEIGAGLVLNDGTLQMVDGPLRTVTPVEALDGDDRLVVWNGDALRAVPAAALRVIHTAGRHVAINPDGTISAIWPTAEDLGASSAFDVAALPRAVDASGDDLVPLYRNGSLRAVTYDRLLSGITLEQAPAASECQAADTFWVGQQGPALVRQTLGALWSWLMSRLPEARLPSVELTGDTSLDHTVHNGRVLLCTNPLTLTPLTGNMGDGFHCEVINLSQGSVTLGSGIMTSSGQALVGPRQAALLRCFAYSGGIVVHASVSGSSALAAIDPPGAPGALAVTAIDSTEVSLAWTAPGSGSGPFSYAVRYRVTGTSPWTSAAGTWTIPAATIAGLLPGTTYEFVVIATNTGGAGPSSIPVPAQTLSGVQVPGQVTNVVAVAQDSTSIALSWNAPSSGGPAATYTIQYRAQGTSVWSGNLPGLTVLAYVVTRLSAGSSHEFRVLAVNAGGSGAASSIATAMTPAMSGAVTSIQWNLTPVGPYAAGAGAIGLNVHVNPASAPVRFGFSASPTVRPAQWTNGIAVNTDLWGVYAPTPATAGTWYAWAEGTDASASTPWPTAFTVQ